jgi:hypothetical protein
LTAPMTGVTMLRVVTGLPLPMPGQVTVEVIFK